MPAARGSPAGPNQWFWGAPVTHNKQKCSGSTLLHGILLVPERRCCCPWAVGAKDKTYTDTHEQNKGSTPRKRRARDFWHYRTDLRTRGARADACVRGAVDGVCQHRVQEGGVVGHDGGRQVVGHALTRLQHQRELLLAVLGHHLQGRRQLKKGMNAGCVCGVIRRRSLRASNSTGPTCFGID